MAALFSAPQAPSLPPPPEVVPMPDRTSVLMETTRQEALSRTKKGKQANLLSGPEGDTSSPTKQKTLLGS